MDIEFQAIGNTGIAEVVTDKVIIHSAEDGVDLIGNVYYQGFEKVIVYRESLSHDFFDLKTGMAGEILQKFSDHHVRLDIEGDLYEDRRKSQQDFISESNTGTLNQQLSAKKKEIKQIKNKII